jgi:phospholipid/cholesterol/gamma-HCH transport system substrate-binding protein
MSGVRADRITPAARRELLLARLDRVVGVVLIVILVGLVTFAYKYYVGDLTRSVSVTLRADRSGLMLDRGAKVSVRGVKVGTVRSVTADGTSALIQLNIEPDRAQELPTNVVAALKPTTLFGAKYVALSEPARPAPARLADGDQIRQAGNEVEADKVFQNVMILLAEVQPEKVNSTLTALSGALGGRGAQLGETITQFNAYLVGLMPSIDTLGRDLELANDVLPAYRTAAPDLITAIDNYRTTGSTLVQEKPVIGSFLSTLTTTGGKTTALMIDAGPPLTRTVRELKPTTAALSRYSPQLTCLLQGLANMDRLSVKTSRPGLNGRVAFLPPARPYTYPEDLPKVAADTGPNCRGLPLIPPGGTSPHYDFDVGRSPFLNGVPAGGGR